MASIGEDRDRLLKAFLDSERRKRKNRKPPVDRTQRDWNKQMDAIRKGAAGRFSDIAPPGTDPTIRYASPSTQRKIKRGVRKVIRAINPFD
jgi:hypothetical protein